ncbi:P2Y purinoceptor 8-like isoform X1 [Paramormyrops kingsleyae]|uniref:P2Y purinoceptor 8-like isoform X1 n=2 Tax=Paramormyrops kingsleyae TaxID=1676925 RepID=UPI003B96FD68
MSESVGKITSHLYCLTMTQNFSPNLLDNTTLAFFRDKSMSGAVSAAYVLISLINFPANGLSMWLLVFRTSPKRPSIIFMINLTLTDLIIGCVLPFQTIYLMKGYNWTFGSRMCSLTTVLLYANMYCSILTMTAISIDRYIGIVRPMNFKNVRKNFWAVIVCVVFWAVVLAVLYPLESTDLMYQVPDLNITTCFDVLKYKMLPTVKHWILYLMIWCGVLFLIPFIITIFCYVNIIHSLAKTRSDRKDKALRLALYVLLVFIVCFAPNNILLVAHGIRRLFYGDSLYTAYKLSLSLSCLNSCLDPFIYYFASKEFRQNFRKVLGLKRARNQDSSQQHTSHHTLLSMK